MPGLHDFLCFICYMCKIFSLFNSEFPDSDLGYSNYTVHVLVQSTICIYLSTKSASIELEIS